MPKDPLKLFQPQEAADLLHGWHLHVARRRLIHEEAARWAQSGHYIVGTLAAGLAAFTGSSLVSTWDTVGTDDTLVIAGGVMGALAAILAAVQTFLDLGGRAERHRQAANEYKDLLRQFERVSEQQVDGAICGRMADDELCAWVIQIQRTLRVVDDKAPVVPQRRARNVERREAASVTKAVDLTRPATPRFRRRMRRNGSQGPTRATT